MGSRLHRAGRHHWPSRARPEALAARKCPAAKRVVSNLRHVAWRAWLREPHRQACSLSVGLLKRRRACVAVEAGSALCLNSSFSLLCDKAGARRQRRRRAKPHPHRILPRPYFNPAVFSMHSDHHRFRDTSVNVQFFSTMSLPEVR